MFDFFLDECEMEIVMEKLFRVKCWYSCGSLVFDGSGYYSVLICFLIESNFLLNGIDVVSYDSGYESGVGLKLC